MKNLTLRVYYYIGGSIRHELFKPNAYFKNTKLLN